MSNQQSPRTKAKIQENTDLLMAYFRKKFPEQVGRSGTVLSDEIEQMVFNALSWTADDVQAQAGVAQVSPNGVE